MSNHAEVLNTCMHPPAAGWDDRLPRQKRNWWVFLWVYSLATALFAGAWFWIAPNHEIPSVTRPVSPASFHAEVESFVKQYETAPGSGIVRVPPGVPAYLEGRMWSWYPTLELKAGQEYTIWLSSVDVDHSVGIAGGSKALVIDAIPGHAFGLQLTPDKPGTYLLYCTEFCGLGHQDMGSKLIVTP